MNGYAILALSLFLLWVLLSGVGRLALQRRRTGDSGFRFATAPPGSLQWWTNRITGAASVTVGVAAPVAALLGMPAVAWLESTSLRATATAGAVVGIACTCAAQLAMGDSWRIGVDPAERTHLVTTGPFALVRNPIFAAALLTFACLALMVPNVVALVGLAVLYAGMPTQVRAVEEPHLLAAHGQAYAAYAGQVGRFLPGLGHLRPPARA